MCKEAHLAAPDLRRARVHRRVPQARAPAQLGRPLAEAPLLRGPSGLCKRCFGVSNEAKDFEELASFAERIGDRQHVRGQETRAASNPGSGSSHRSSMPHTSAPPRRAPIHTPSNAFNPIPEAPAAPASDYDDGGVRPMEVDASRRKTKPTLRRGPVTASERAYRLKHNLYGYCGGANHYSDGCPQPRVPRQERTCVRNVLDFVA